MAGPIEGPEWVFPHSRASALAIATISQAPTFKNKKLPAGAPERKKKLKRSEGRRQDEGERDGLRGDWEEG